jgi:FixJ family two-component response regulator
MVPEPILLVDDEPDLRNSLREALETDGYTVEEADSTPSALARIGRRHYPVIITDLNMPGGPSGLELIAAVKARDPKALCIIITGYATLNASIQALKSGAYDFIQKPFKLEELEAVVDRALEHARLQRQLDDYQRDLEGRVAARVGELKAFHGEALRLNALLREALGETEVGAMVRPFLEYLKVRFAPDGFVLLLPGQGEVWEILHRHGNGPWAAFGSLPRPEAFDEIREWGWEGGYPDGYLVPLRQGERTLGALFLGFATRTAFHPEDPAFDLWRNQLEATLQALDRARSLATGAKRENSGPA